MGMYDNLKCNFPLPNKEVQDEEFQTKDLTCNLDHLEITSGGRLVQHVVAEFEDDEEGVLDLNYHGYICFYTYLKNGEDTEWYRYTAKFNNGQLQAISRKK